LAPRAALSAAANWRTWTIWLVVMAAVTGLMIPFRQFLSETMVALAYLLVVLFAGARSGRATALTVAVVAFLSFNFFFQPPYATLALADPKQWFVLVAFLVASVVATQLFERSRHEAVLQESVRSRDAVIASLSHDLRAPLTSIKAVAHHIVEGGDDRARVIVEESDRLNTLVGDVLDLSRLSSGSLALNVELNDGEDVLGSALQRIAASWPGRTVDVHLAEGDAALFGRFDFASTLRILVNLIDNALKYSASFDVVDVVVAREGQWLSFQVLDRGDGVSPDDRERIFEPFYRPRGMAPDIHGAGLGLSIGRALAEAQGGSLAYSVRQGGGSVLTLRVPAADLAGSR
jgi:two-component system sensor histidine kinase KdpD